MNKMYRIIIKTLIRAKGEMAIPLVIFVLHFANLRSQTKVTYEPQILYIYIRKI